MASSSIEIINKALLLLGANVITSLDEGSNESTIVGALYPAVRKSCLSIHPWNFAITEVELPAVTGGSSFKHQYQYNWPSDCLRLLRVYDDPDYKVKGRSVYTNSDSCKIRYIFDNVDTTTWTPTFDNLVAHKLAAELAYPITKSTSLMEAMTNLYGRFVIEAKAIDASEDIEDEISSDHPFISVRY